MNVDLANKTQDMTAPHESRELRSVHKAPVILSVRMTPDYSNIRQKLVDAMKGGLPGATWVLFEAREDDKPVVIAIIDRPSREDQVSLVQKVEDLLGPIVGEHFLIRVAQGQVGLARSRCPTDAYNNQYQQEVEAGASIGVEGIGWSGTFGCYLQDTKTHQIVGLTCGHNLAINEIPIVGSPPLDPLRLFPQGTKLVQPSEPDRIARLPQVEHAAGVQKMKISKTVSGNILPSYAGTEKLKFLEGQLSAAEQELAGLQDPSPTGTTFGSVLAAQLSLSESRIRDYALINVTARQGGGTIGARSLIHPERCLSEYQETTVEMVGRTTGPSSGVVDGYICDAMVERFAEPFTCQYARGHNGAMHNVGGSGAVVVVEHGQDRAEVIGYVFGGGIINDMNVNCTWLCCMQTTLSDIEKHEGVNFQIWNEDASEGDAGDDSGDDSADDSAE